MTFFRSNRTLLITIAVAIIIVFLATRGMSAPTAVSILLSGLTLGSLFFLVASGLSLIFGLMDVLNFAHGSLFMLGAYAGWTIYTNPRLILNTAPLGFALIAGVMLMPIVARKISLPRVARYVAALLAAALVLLSVRDFPLQKLVAFGTTVSGQVVATVDAQESLNAMLTRFALMLVAGIVLSFAWARREKANEETEGTKGTWSRIGAMTGLLVAALVMLFGRDAMEQVVLGTDSNLRFVIALLVGAGTGAGLGALMEFGLIRPLYARPIYQVLLTLGLVFIFDQVVRLVWGPAGAFMQMPGWFANTGKECPAPNLIDWFGLHCDAILVLGRPFPSYRLFIILVGIVMLIGIGALLRGSRLGMIIRAGVQDSAMVEALGINVRRVFTIVFALGAGLAGLGGVVATPFLGVYPGMALEFLLEAFIVVVIGGLGSVPGAALGALVVGLARAYGDQVVLTGIQLPFMTEPFTGSPAIARASTVLIMVIVLLLKPTGLLGKKEG